MVCPRCSSDSITIIVDQYTETKSYSPGYGICGYLLFGWVGLLCGLCGTGSSHHRKEQHVCNQCGYRF
jgi:hypothetical protein